MPRQRVPHKNKRFCGGGAFLWGGERNFFQMFLYNPPLPQQTQGKQPVGSGGLFGGEGTQEPRGWGGKKPKQTWVSKKFSAKNFIAGQQGSASKTQKSHNNPPQYGVGFFGTTLRARRGGGEHGGVPFLGMGGELRAKGKRLLVPPFQAKKNKGLKIILKTKKEKTERL